MMKYISTITLFLATTLVVGAQENEVKPGLELRIGNDLVVGAGGTAGEIVHVTLPGQNLKVQINLEQFEEGLRKWKESESLSSRTTWDRKTRTRVNPKRAAQKEARRTMEDSIRLNLKGKPIEKGRLVQPRVNSRKRGEIELGAAILGMIEIGPKATFEVNVDDEGGISLNLKEEETSTSVRLTWGEVSFVHGDRKGSFHYYVAGDAVKLLQNENKDDDRDALNILAGAINPDLAYLGPVMIRENSYSRIMSGTGRPRIFEILGKKNLRLIVHESRK